MSDTEARDAYLAVDVELPNGTTIKGKPLPFGVAKRLLLLDEQFTKGADPSASLFPMLNEFAEHTGITEDQVLAACPDIQLGEVIDLVRRFFFSRRTVATATPLPVTNPTPAPATPAPGA